MQAKANKDIIKVTLTQYEFSKMFESPENYHSFLAELINNIAYAERRYRLKGDHTYQSYSYDQWLKRCNKEV